MSPPDGPALPHPFVRDPGASDGPLIAPAELARLRAGPDPPMLLDVRSDAERRLGRLPNDRAVPLAALLEGHPGLPMARPIVVYDGFGEVAPRAAAALRARGFAEVRALEGGYDAYARIVDPSLGRYRADGDGPLVLQLPRPETGCLAYLVADPVERRAVLIDPGLDVAPYLARLRAADWHLDAIVETHTHADHLAGHAELHRRTDAPILLSHRSPASYPHAALTGGEEVGRGRASLVVLETPGHTVDHLTLRLPDRIFTGDTLLIGSCGRSDLPGGDPRTLFRSLQDVLRALPMATEVLPAHFGPKHALVDRYVSTLGVERATNEAFRIDDEAEFVKYMTEGWPPKPEAFDRIVAANLADGPAGG